MSNDEGQASSSRKQAEGLDDEDEDDDFDDDDDSEDEEAEDDVMAEWSLRMIHSFLLFFICQRKNISCYCLQLCKTI